MNDGAIGWGMINGCLVNFEGLKLMLKVIKFKVPRANQRYMEQIRNALLENVVLLMRVERLIIATLARRKIQELVILSTI